MSTKEGIIVCDYPVVLGPMLPPQGGEPLGWQVGVFDTTTYRSGRTTFHRLIES